MKRNIKRSLWILLTAMVVCLLVPTYAMAAEGEYSTKADAVAVIRHAMVERKNEVTVQIAGELCGTEEARHQYAADLMELAMAHTGKPKEGDYLRFHLDNWSSAGTYFEDNGVGYHTYTFQIQYYDTAAHQAQLDEWIALVLNERIQPEQSDAEKVQGIYDYVTEMVRYDYERLQDENYKLKYTAYDAAINNSAVCQGYANYIYRLMLELGIDCRIIAGTSNGQNHAWNIVKLDGKYYCLDATWDAGRTSYAYFLKGSSGFINHESEAKYLNGEFTAAYPISEKDYAVVSGQEPETWANFAAADFSGGSGTEKDPYVIRTAAELALLANYCNQQDEMYKRCWYTLGSDIDLSGHDWMPIGAIKHNEDTYLGFHGVFDGKGYTISNLRIDQDYDGFFQFGLFGFSEGTVRNVVLKDAVIAFASSRSGWQADNGMGSSLEVGGLCAWNAGLMENCSVVNVHIDVSSKMSLNCGGAVASLNYGSMKNVLVSGSVSGLAARAIWAGGCVGNISNEASVEACGFSGTVRAETENIDHVGMYGCHPVHYVGGFCGSAGRANSGITIKDCYAVADIYSKYPYPTQSVGAFAGAIGVVYKRGIYENLVGNAQITADRGGVIDREVNFWQGEVGFGLQSSCDEWRYKNCTAIAGDEIVVYNVGNGIYDRKTYSVAKVNVTDLFVNTLKFDGTRWNFDDAGIPSFSGQDIGDRPTEPKPTEPKPTEPAPTQPAPTEPAPTQPKPTEPNPEQPTVSGVNRVAGENRYATGTVVADQLKTTLGVDKFSAIVVASGREFPDALAGSYLANQKGAPILLVNSKDAKSFDNAKNYIAANLATGGTVYILGGEAAVPAQMEKVLSGYNVKRLAGSNRYGTNLEILKEAGTAGQEILICTGKGFADSLSASAVNKPILLLNNKTITADQRAFLENSSKKFIIIGGTSAISAEMEAELKTIGSVERIAGDNRYKTSVAVANRFFKNPDTVVVAYAKKFPDGLCGGPLACSLNAPLILTAAKVEAEASAYTKANGIKDGLVLGGTGALSDDTVNKVFG